MGCSVQSLLMNISTIFVCVFDRYSHDDELLRGGPRVRVHSFYETK